MGRPRTRTWDEHTGIARAVDAVGGIGFAAAFADVSQEAVRGWLEKGEVPLTKYAIRLSRATMAHGKPVSIEALAGMAEETVPTGTDGARLRRRSAVKMLRQMAPSTTSAAPVAQKGGKSTRTSPRKVSRLFTQPAVELAA